MRILLTFIGGIGHFQPLVPVARAAEAAGHTVAVAGSGKVTPSVEASGFTAFATSGPRPPGEPAAAPEPLERPDPAAAERHFSEAFGRPGARRHAAALLKIAAEWKPDVIVRDEADFGSAIAAERLDIPCATLLVLAAGSLLRKELLVEPLGELRAEYALPPDPGLAMLDRDLVLSPFPPSFRSPGFPLPATAFSFRPGQVTRPSEVARPAVVARSGWSSAWPGFRADLPTVYFTLGTVFQAGPDDLLSRVLAGLREVSANVVVTVGERNDPAVLGPQPDHVRVERFIPQDELLPYCDLVVSHGGSGSVIGALAHGLPSVLLPLGADQPHNAQRCTELGVGQALDAVSVTPAEVVATVSTMLTDQNYRQVAQRIQTEINDLPGVEHTVPLLEQLLPA